MTATRSGNTNVMVDPSSLTFTSTDWEHPEAFTVSSTDNEERGRWDEDRPISVRFASSSSDTNDDGLAGPRVRVEIGDDEGAGASLEVEPQSSVRVRSWDSHVHSRAVHQAHGEGFGHA